METMWIASLLVHWVLVLLMAFLLLGSLRQLALVQLRLGDDPGALVTNEGLDRGTDAPDFRALDAETGSALQFWDLPSQARVLVFLSPTCLACQHLIPHLNEIFETRGDEFDFRVICRSGLAACREFRNSNELKVPMLVDASGEAEHSFQVRVTPFTYVLDYQQRILMRGIANDWRHFESLLDQEGTLEAGKVWSPVEVRVS